MRITLCIAWVCFLLSSNAVQAKDATVNSSIAYRMTCEAKDAGSAGELELREDLLAQALRMDPNCSSAHWAKGEMQVDGNWVSVKEIQNAAAANDLNKQYLERRDACGESAEEQLELARWCRKHSLNDEARYHWLAVLATDQENREALQALDSAWYEGQLVSTDEAKQLREQTQQLRKQTQRWRARIAGWERALKLGGDDADLALAELDAEVNESAIAEFERLATRRAGVTDAEKSRNNQLCQAFIQALGRLPSYEAGVSLVRFSVMADDEELRSLAAQQLISRPDYEYVPLLITGLSSKLEGRFALTVTPTGRVQYDHQVFTEGPNGDEVTEISRTGGAVVTVAGQNMSAKAQQTLSQGREISRNHYQQYEAEAARRQEAIAEMNTQREEQNAKIIAVLKQTTGQDLGDSPQAWWDYWYQNNGYEDRSQMPVQTYRVSTSQQVDLYVPQEPPSGSGPPSSGPPSSGGPPTRHECFAAGTLVWTKTGMQAIDTLKPGDLVLTMDEQTGELSFRPVLNTTLRAPSPLVNLTAGGYQLTSTPGHPFWVEGRGWQMAKELQPGDQILSSTGRPVELVSVEDSGTEQEAYNLIVEGNNNYFVGPQGLLSHDNSARRPELARAAGR